MLTSLEIAEKELIFFYRVETLLGHLLGYSKMLLNECPKIFQKYSEKEIFKNVLRIRSINPVSLDFANGKNKSQAANLRREVNFVAKSFDDACVKVQIIEFCIYSNDISNRNKCYNVCCKRKIIKKSKMSIKFDWKVETDINSKNKKTFSRKSRKWQKSTALRSRACLRRKFLVYKRKWKTLRNLTLYLFFILFFCFLHCYLSSFI